MICMMTIFKRYTGISITLLCVACSAPVPAPIKDQSTPINQPKPVVIPNWSVTNTPKPATNAVTPTKPKPTASANTEAKQNKPPAIEPPPKTETAVSDPGFKIAKPSNASVIDVFNGFFLQSPGGGWIHLLRTSHCIVIQERLPFRGRHA